LGRIELVLLNGNRQLSEQWRKLVEAHPYLGYRPLCRAQPRYLIRCRYGDIGSLSFSTPAYRLKARDRWIGWSEAARRLHLERVVCNSRFVLAGGVKVPNLASKYPKNLRFLPQGSPQPHSCIGSRDRSMRRRAGRSSTRTARTRWRRTVDT